MENTTENSIIGTLSERIKPFFSAGIKSRTSIFCNIKRDKELYKEILETTTYLPNNVTFAQRVYDALHNLIEITTCKICGIKQPFFISFTNGYRTYCCQECAGLDAEKIKKTTDKLIGRKLSEEHIQNRSKAQKGRPKSDSFKKMMSERMKGNTYGEASKGRVLSEEARRKLLEANIGRPAWNKGKKMGPLSDEHKRKMSESLTGRIVSEETRQNMSKAQKGKKISEETRRKISESNKGKIPWHKGKTGVYSEETLKKISENTKKAMENPEYRQKMSDVRKGKRLGEDNPFYGKHHTEETKQLISKNATGRIMAEETKQKISESTKGKIFSEETRNKISESLKGNNWNLGKRGKKASPEARDNISKAAIQRLLNNDCKNVAWKHSKKGQYFSDKNNKEIRYESSYELAAYKILEQMSKVLSYDRCPYSIDYEFEGYRRYLPDILVAYEDGSKEIIEVKPEYELKNEKVQAKKLAGEYFCGRRGMSYTIWTEKELF